MLSVLNDGTESIEHVPRLSSQAKQKNRCTNVFGSVGHHGVGLARYDNMIAAKFAAAHACRTNTKRFHQTPWCCSEQRWVKVNCDGVVNPP
ncbi:hypothetical protein V6N11_016698 [Hibiscus sabdariffa]|uniref:Uncharacterized protein n=1 Tax=Hibiscus sabdariffa TaxID=183260 RepID=A0ABR2TVR1_9ROSI